MNPGVCFSRSVIISVRKGPGAIALTRMPCDAHSSAMLRVKAISAALLEQYKAS